MYMIGLLVIASVKTLKKVANAIFGVICNYISGIAMQMRTFIKYRKLYSWL